MANTFRLQFALEGDCDAAPQEFTADEMLSYVELSDALRVFESVIIQRFLTAQPGTDVRQRDWLFDTVMGILRDAYDTVARDPETQLLDCRPFCGDDGRCYVCRVIRVSEPEGSDQPAT